MAKWLIVHRGYGAAEVRQAALEWLRFLVPNYYLAKALEAGGESPGVRA